jgi:multiple antibiotic resistance protein
VNKILDNIFLHALTSFIVIVDPIGCSLIFNSLTQNENSKRRKILAIKSVSVAVLVIIFFAAFGEPMLHRLGISIDALRVAGGILLFITAYNLITAAPKYEVSENFEGDISVYPMAIPMLAGPGTMTVAVLLFAGASTTTDIVKISSAIFITYLTALLALLATVKISSFIGKTGNDVIRRLMGVLLAALSVQFIADGAKALFLN